MKLERREIIVLCAGAMIVLLSIAYGVKKRSARSLASSPRESTLASALDRVSRFDELRSSVEQLKKELDVEIPEGSPGDQETAILDEIGRRARASGLEYTSLKPAQSSSRSLGSGSKPVQFRIDLTGRFEDVAAFMLDLEKSSRPYVIKEVHIDSAGRAARDASIENMAEFDEEAGPPPPGNGRVRAMLKIQSYLFPAQKG